MAFSESLEHLAKALALFDPADRSALEDLGRAFSTWEDAVRALDGEALTQSTSRIQELLAQLEQPECSESAFRELSRVVSWLHDAATKLDAGFAAEDLEALAPQESRAEPQEPVDLELLGLFVSSCETTLADLEAEVLGAEKAEDPEESIAGIRRTIHTFKGECGVLSLRVAQELCHRMETAIDIATEAHAKIPADLTLSLVDWLRNYVQLLRDDNHAEPPESAELSHAIDAYLDGIHDGDDAGGADSDSSSGTETDSDALVTFEIDEDYLENLPEFLSETQQHVGDAEAAVLEFDRDGREDLELIDRTFRAFHTIKGVAGFLNLTAVVELAHTAETLMDGLRKQSFACTTAMVDLILQSCDALSRLVDVLQGQAVMSRSQLDRLIEDLVRITKNPGQEIDTTPAPANTADAEGPERDAPAETPEDREPARQEAPESTPGDSAKAGTGVAENTVAVEPARKSAEPRAAPEMDPSKKNAKRTALTKKLDSTITVSTKRLDSLVDLVGELVISQSMIAQDPQILKLTSQKLSRNLSQVNKITRDLQEGAMSLRMVTLKSTFQKMARLVRDVSAKAQKRVDFQISGEETELDRNVVEEISDPLVHMIRNAIDHGIERPGDRTAAGKSETGVLHLKAYHQGGSIVIEISDDGRGLARDKIFRKAKERGLVAADRSIDDLTDAEVYGLVFQAGFSTAEKVTDISGRGVGMDVVKRNIEALRGKVEIESRMGEGTTFKMMLPLTLAIIDGMVVRCGTQRYVIPTLAIVQSFQPAAEQITKILDEGETVRIRGDLLPVRKLREIFGLSEGEIDPTKGLLIVVEDNSTRSCLLVDEILGQQQVVIKTLGKGTGHIQGVTGGAILGDGRIALILDITGLLEGAVTQCN